MIELERVWIFSVKYDLSMVIIWETLITLSLGNFDFLEESKTLPGAAARRVFDVITTAIIVLILLSLNSFDWMISTGLWYPGPEPTGSGSVAHQISPRLITILLFLSSWTA